MQVTNVFVLLGTTQSRRLTAVTLFSFCPSLTIMEQQNKFLSLVTMFDSRRRGRRITVVPNSTNAWTLAAMLTQRS